MIKLLSKFLCAIIFINTGITNCQDSSTNTTSIYSDEYKLLKNNTIFRNYYKYDNTNKTDILYVEFSYLENNETGTLSYHKISVHWFLNLTISNFSSGLFYGIGQTEKNLVSGELFSDLVICKINYIQSRCDDYHMSHSGGEIEDNYKTQFQPVLDYKANGTDNILSYQANKLITDSVSPFSSLLNYYIILPSYHKNNKHDLDLNFRNNVTIFFGELVRQDSEDQYNEHTFNIMRIYTKNFSEIISGSEIIKSNSIICFLIFILFL